MAQSDRILLMDHREHAELLKGKLTSQYGFNVVEEQLSLGDYSFEPNTVIERKTTKDFCLSLIDGKLFRQAYLLANHKGSALMIVEGQSYTCDHDIDINVLAVKGALITLAQTFRLPILRTVDEADTAWHINQIYEQRKTLGKGCGPLHGRKPKKLEARKGYVLKSFPGNGAKAAEALLDQFGTITDIVNADDDELLTVDGIGPKTVRQIRDVLNEAEAPYNIFSAEKILE